MTGRWHNLREQPHVDPVKALTWTAITLALIGFWLTMLTLVANLVRGYFL